MDFPSSCGASDGAGVEGLGPSTSGPGVVDGLGRTAVSAGGGLDVLGAGDMDDGTSTDVVSVAVSRGGELDEGCTELDSVVVSAGGPDEGRMVSDALVLLAVSWSSVESPVAVELSSAELVTDEGPGFMPAVAYTTMLSKLDVNFAAKSGE